MIIAIDGPAAAGKGTLAQKVAKEFNCAYLDTGSLYRCVGLMLLKEGQNPDDADKAAAAAAHLDRALLTDPSLRDEATGMAASIVATMPEVRSNLLEFQRNFSKNPPEGFHGAVLDGRDVGTVVCPGADVKFFVTASAEQRAHRRTLELEARGERPDYGEILADVKARDARDMGRKDAPLKPAEDALLLDTTELDIDAVFLRAAQFINERVKPQ